jgi:hypothetical protein
MELTNAFLMPERGGAPDMRPSTASQAGTPYVMLPTPLDVAKVCLGGHSLVEFCILCGNPRLATVEMCNDNL